MGVARIAGYKPRVERKELGADSVYMISDVNPRDGLYQAERLHQYCEQALLPVSAFENGCFSISEAEVEKRIQFGTFAQQYICSGLKEAALGKDASLTP